MRDMMICAAVIFSLSEAWSQDPALSGTNQSISVNSSTSSPKVVRNSVFNLGSEVNLTCSNKTWNEMMFVTWTITLKNKECRIGHTNEGRSDDFCNDGKSLQNTSSAQSYLHIPEFSNNDVGVYKCESVYTGGNDIYLIYVDITVSPSISAWLEFKDNKMVAVCKADRGKPAANISWSHAGNSSSVETSSDGFFTVESRLELLEEMDKENLSCAIRHPYWKEEHILRPKKLLKKGYSPWLGILTVAVIIALLAGFLLFAQKKLTTLKRCQWTETPPSKSPPTEDVEEVEPYASYVQRVNSIYCSSADLFT
ncbi:cell surface glycoprotein CD200 receptor 1 isoform X2 [Etheostoma spectabile]|uniref:cell surface glycoprotein CD200 receptor 1 isoform X2 n=1 Tax=Etheostoma spectabile TaxID=54343 RepID=UPI0013AEA646|nr:cell surface glycoprotein CD200 receptor 1-like isoform X2 [Etheostoma spectabile]